METDRICHVYLEQKRVFYRTVKYIFNIQSNKRYRVFTEMVCTRATSYPPAARVIPPAELSPLVHAGLCFVYLQMGGNFNDITRVNVSPYLGIDELGAELT